MSCEFRVVSMQYYIQFGSRCSIRLVGKNILIYVKVVEIEAFGIKLEQRARASGFPIIEA